MSYYKNIFICGEAYSKKQGWMEGALESCHDVMKQLCIPNFGIQMNEKEASNSKRKFIQRLKRHEKLTFALFGIVIVHIFCNLFYVIELSLN